MRVMPAPAAAWFFARELSETSGKGKVKRLLLIFRSSVLHGSMSGVISKAVCEHQSVLIGKSD
jgi:hypothetical protein